MRSLFGKCWIKVLTWIASEVVLNLTGLDNLADYSEFLLSLDDTILDRRPSEPPGDSALQGGGG